MNRSQSQEGFNPLDQQTVDPSDNLVNDYSELIEQEAFIGEVPYPTIVEGIQGQFDDYIGTEDRTDYVDIFFTQLENSYKAAEEDEEEIHQQEIREALDRIRDDFIDTIAEQLQTRLTISISAIESEERDYDAIEWAVRQLYTFFILEAKQTMMTVIKYDVTRILKDVNLDGDEYFKRVNVLMNNYSPLFSTMGPNDFLQLTGNTDIIDMYDNGTISGNFLRKYSPKFYAHEEFEVEVINEITLTYGFAREAKAAIAGDNTG